MVQYCSDCGLEIGDTDKFCKSCGESLTAEVKIYEIPISTIHDDLLDVFRKLQPLAFLGSLSLVLASFSFKYYPQASESASFAGIFFLLAFGCSAFYLCSPNTDIVLSKKRDPIVNFMHSFPLLSMMFATLGVIFLIAAGLDLVKDKPVFSFTASMIFGSIFYLILFFANMSFISNIDLFPKKTQCGLKILFIINMFLLVPLMFNLYNESDIVSLGVVTVLFRFVIITTLAGQATLMWQTRKKTED